MGDYFLKKPLRRLPDLNLPVTLPPHAIITDPTPLYHPLKNS